MAASAVPEHWAFSPYPNATPGPSNFTTDYNDASPIPIDPQLSGFAPSESPNSLFFPNGVEKQESEEPLEPEQRSSVPPTWARNSQGPQGDPFAPPPMPVHFATPTPEVIPPSPKSRKRKKRTQKGALGAMMAVDEQLPVLGPGEKLCDVCKKVEPPRPQPEGWPFYTCTDCGNSAHPTCLKATHLVPFMTMYDWRCLVCKVCDKCQEKEPEDAIIICDNCDRGWHGEACHDPPVPPDDVESNDPWYCQMCPQPTRSYLTDTESVDHDGVYTSPNGAMTNGVGRKKKGRRGGTLKGKEPAVIEEIDVVGDTPQPRHHSQQAYGRRARKSVRGDGPPPLKRARNHSPRPGSVVAQTPIRIKLKLPSSPGKENADLDEDYFADVLDVEQRNTTRTQIKEEDKQRFNQSRMLAEASLIPPKPGEDSQQIGPSGRPLRSSVSVAANRPFVGAKSPALATPGPTLPHPPASPHHLRIQHIRFGDHEIDTWYDAPFPEEYANIPDGCLWICEFCLKYMKSRFGAGRHKLKCKAKHPPGDEIYRDGAISIFEVDGRKNKIYCQNLCLLSKMFLDHKSLFYDVEPFLFYVITEMDDSGARFVGYFSKEKWSANHYNLSCIMTLPIRQRKGWGNMLIDFSYLLSKKEKRMGSPEKPLSALGAIGYRKYWTLSLMRYLQHAPNRIRLEDICAGTSMTLEDVYATLQQQDMISVRDASLPVRPSPGQATKFQKGRRQGLARRHLHRQKTQEKNGIPTGPFKPPEKYRIHWDRAAVDAYLSNWEAKGYIQVKPDKLRWSPFLSTRTNQPVGEEQMDTTHLIANLKISSSSDEEQDSEPSEVMDVDDEEESRVSKTTSPQSFREEEHDSSSEDQSQHHQTPTRTRRRRSTRASATPVPVLPRRTRSGRILRPTMQSDDEMEPPPTRVGTRSRRVVESSPETEECSRHSIAPSEAEDVEEEPDASKASDAGAIQRQESQDYPDATEVLGILGLPDARDTPASSGRSSAEAQPRPSLSQPPMPDVEPSQSPQERTLSPSSPTQVPDVSMSPAYDPGAGDATAVKEEQHDDLYPSTTSPGRKSMAPSDDTVYAVADPKEMLINIEDDEDADADAEGEVDSDWEREQGAMAGHATG